MLKKTIIEPLVIEAIRELVSNETFAKEIKARIGTQIDTTTIDKEMKNYEAKLHEVDLNKARLENEIDTLPADTEYRDRKLHDMTIRLDGLYDIMVELEEKIEDAKLRRRSVERCNYPSQRASSWRQANRSESGDFILYLMRKLLSGGNMPLGYISPTYCKVPQKHI